MDVHVVIFTAIGLFVLAGFALAARLFSRRGHRVDGASPFIWVCG